MELQKYKREKFSKEIKPFYLLDDIEKKQFIERRENKRFLEDCWSF